MNQFAALDFRVFVHLSTDAQQLYFILESHVLFQNFDLEPTLITNIWTLKNQ